MKDIKKLLIDNNITFAQFPIAHGDNFKFTNGTILQVYNNGNYCFTGKRDDTLEKRITDIIIGGGEMNNALVHRLIKEEEDFYNWLISDFDSDQLTMFLIHHIRTLSDILDELKEVENDN